MVLVTIAFSTLNKVNKLMDEFTITPQKMKFSIKDFFSKCNQIRRFSADLVTFTEEILNGRLHFLCSVEGCSQVSQIRSKNRSYKEKITTGEIYSKRLKIESKLEKNNKKNIKY